MNQMTKTQNKRKFLIIGLIIMGIMIAGQQKMVKKESLADEPNWNWCHNRYDDQIADGDQCVILATLTPSLLTCIESSCEFDLYDLSVCTVFYEADSCRTTKGGTFGYLDVCIYNCFLGVQTCSSGECCTGWNYYPNGYTCSGGICDGSGNCIPEIDCPTMKINALSSITSWSSSPTSINKNNALSAITNWAISC